MGLEQTNEPLEVEVIGNIAEMISNESVSDVDILIEINKLKMKTEREQYIQMLNLIRKLGIGNIRKDLAALYKEDIHNNSEPIFPDYLQTDLGIIYHSTFDNMKTLLEDVLDIQFFYDVITKEVTITKWGDVDEAAWNKLNNRHTKLISHIMSESVKKMLQKATVIDHLDSVLMTKEKNPLLDTIKEGKWDGEDHIEKMVKQIKSDSGNFKYRKDGITKWLIQCVAAWDGSENTPRKDAKAKYELVLVLGGSQGIRKTDFWHALMPNAMNKYLADGALLKMDDKDSVSQFTSYGMVELGELEATFKKSDIAELKAFLSRQFDEYRLPYARKPEKHRRRTVFGASVNTNQFLNDPTGSRRFVYMLVTKMIDVSDIDIEQLWKQVWQLYLGGERWWFIEGDDSLKIQRKVNSQATDSGLVGDAIQELKQKLSHLGKVNAFERHSATKIWTFLMGTIPNTLNRSQFYVDLEKLSKDKDFKDYGVKVSKKNGVTIPVGIIIKTPFTRKERLKAAKRHK